MFKFTGRRPGNLGLQDGRLAPVSSKPNSVSSQATDRGHAIEPLRYSGDAGAAFARLAKLVQSQPLTEVVQQTPTYLYAEFSTKLMGFVDDVEFALSPAEGVIHVRSASRLGYSDMGVNRKRVEGIRAQFGS